MSEPTIEEIMRFHRQTNRILFNSETLPENEIDELNELERKTRGYDLREILFSRIKELEAEIEALKAALKEKTDTCYLLQTEHLAEIDKLKQENRILREGLETLTINYADGNSIIADETLEKANKVRGG